MNEKLLPALIEESIRMEQNSAALYRIFHKVHPDDADFWWQLHLEEKSHAMLLRAAQDSYTKRGQYPEGIVADCLEVLRNDNDRLENLVKQHRENPPERSDCFTIAIEIETSIGESHYDLFMDKEPSTPIEKAFQQLNRADKSHEKRIREQLQLIQKDH